VRFLRQLRRRQSVPILLVCGFSLLITLAARYSGTLEYLELTAYDWYLRTSLRPSPADPRIVLIGITENDIRRLQKWPLADEVAARALTVLLADQPRAVGFDIYRDLPVPPGTEELQRLLTDSQRLIMVMKFGAGGVAAPPVLARSGRVGFNDMIVDPGGIVRRGLLFLDNGKTVSTSFDLLLAMLYLRAEGIVPRADGEHPEYLRLGPNTIRPFAANDGGYLRADDRGYQFLLDFGGSRGAFTAFSLGELLAGKVPPAAIRDKIVIIGVMAQSVKDIFYTPYSRGMIGGGQAIPGMVMHAHVVSQLLHLGLGESRPLLSPSESEEICWIIFWCLAGGAVGFWLRSPWVFSLCGAGGLFLLWLATYAIFLRGWWLPSVPPAITFLLAAALVTAYMANQEKEQRTVLMLLFSKHVSPEVATAIWQHREQFLCGGRPRSQKVMATVLFSDLKGYTSTAESLEPQALINWLNSYMEAMADLVMVHGGVVDDYAGDGIKANFGVPLPRQTEKEIKQDAIQAVRCALAMGRKMEQLNKSWRHEGLPTGSTRIGIFSGPVVAGAVGSSQRLKYTTVGDTVNVAARLESYQKEFAGDSCWRILIGEQTRQYLDGRFRLRLVGKETLKGKSQEITIYQVLGINESPCQRLPGRRQTEMC